VPKIRPLLFLDAWRGIAALWVVMTHACIAFLATGDNERFLHFPLYAVSAHGQLGVTLFFVISGYCIMGAAYAAFASGRGVMGYGFDRLRRIYPPYLAACVLMLVIGFLTGFAQGHHLLPAPHHHPDYSAWSRPQFWLANALLLQAEWNQPTLLLVAWSLCYEIFFYGLIGVMLFFAQIVARGRDLAAGLPVFRFGTGALMLLSLFWLILSPATCPFPLDRWYQFGLGSLLFLAGPDKSPLAGWPARIHLGLALFFTLVFAIRHDLSASPGGLVQHFVLGQPSTREQAVTCLLFTCVLWMLRPFDEYLARQHFLRPLLWTGAMSYSIYLIHPLVMPFPDESGRLLGFDRDWYWVTYFVQIAVALFAGWLFHLAVERHFISSRQKKRVAEELRK
jgi:exopolysaccharide production protein ExoZ